MALQSKSRLIIFIAILLAAFVLAGVSAGIYAGTIMPWWMPFAVAAVPAFITVPAFISRWQRLSEVSSNVVNALCHIAVVGSVASFIFLGINRWCADAASEHVERTTVISKHSREHTRYRRVGRRNVASGTYHTYHLTLEFADGRKKETEVPVGTYSRTRTGSHRNLTLARGFFGYPVIR